MEGLVVGPKSEEPEPVQEQHLSLAGVREGVDLEQQHQSSRSRMAVSRPPRQAPSTSIEMKYFLSRSESQGSPSSGADVVVAPVSGSAGQTSTTTGMVAERASGRSSRACNMVFFITELAYLHH